MKTKVIFTELTHKAPRTNPDYPSETNTFYGEDSREKALLESEKYKGYLMTIRTVERIIS